MVYLYTCIASIDSCYSYSYSCIKAFCEHRALSIQYSVGLQYPAIQIHLIVYSL